jgi:hypothetical protein
MEMEYQITQVITYWVHAETAQEALDKWNEHPRTGVTQWQDNGIELSDEHVEVNGL